MWARRAGGAKLTAYRRAHANLVFPVGIIIAIWLCFLSVVLIGYHHSALRLLLLVPAILLHLSIAYRIRPGAPR